MQEGLARTLRLTPWFPAASVTGPTVLLNTRGVIYQYTGPPKAELARLAMRRRGPCTGGPAKRVPVQGEVLNITAPCVWEPEASFMITPERSETNLAGSRSGFL